MRGDDIQNPTPFPTAHIFNKIRRLAGYPFIKQGNEPFLDDVMADPIIRQLMAADNLSEPDVRRTIRRAQSGLRLR